MARTPKKPKVASRQWNPLKAETEALILKRLDNYHVKQNLDRLLACGGVNRNDMLHRLDTLRIYRPEMEPRKYPKKKARDNAKRILNAADLIQSLNDDAVTGVALQGDNWHLTAALPALLRCYAQRVEELPDYVQEKWEPVKVAAISQLIWYVRTSTGDYHDEDVSAIVGAFLYDGGWTADALKQWRMRNALAIQRLGPWTILPAVPRSPKR